MYVEECARFSLARVGARGACGSSFAALLPTLLAVVTLGGLGPACSASVGGGDAGSPDGPSIEVGPTDLSSFDTSIEALARPPSCKVASQICDGNQLHACVLGATGDVVAGDVIAICPEACSYGRCVSAACLDAEQNDPIRGCRFYPVQVDNVDADDDKSMMLMLTNSSPVPANAYLQVRSADAGWVPSSTVVVPAHASARLETHRPARNAGVTPMGAFRLDTDGPVSVVELVSDDVDRASTSSGGTVLRPVHALDSYYLTVSYPQVSNSKITATAGGRDGAGMIVVVGTVDQTTVSVRSAVPLLVDSMTTFPSGGAPYSVSLNEGDVLQIFSAAPAADLTGTRVDADHPVQVFSGNVFTGYNNEVTGLNGADLAFEQLPPVNGWGTSYVGAWLAPQAGCDPYFGKGAGSWQVLAAKDDTLVTITPSDTTVIDQKVFLLNSGISQRFIARAPQALIDAGGPLPPTDFVVTSTSGHPILLVQWLDCEPGLALGIDARLISRGPPGSPPPADTQAQPEQEVVVAFPPGFDHQLVIVRRLGWPVWIDGMPIPDDQFHRISSKQPFEVARYSAEELGQCVDLSDGCSHVIRGDRVGVTWRGMDVVCSYAVTLPSNDTCQLFGVPCEG